MKLFLQDRQHVFTGELLVGCILFDEKDFKLNKLVLLFQGKQHVHWISGGNYTKRSQTSTFSVVEFPLIDCGEGSQWISTGHRENFSIRIPANLPPSLKITCGWIKYSLQVKLKKAGKGIFLKKTKTLSSEIRLFGSFNEAAYARNLTPSLVNLQRKRAIFGNGSIIFQSKLDRTCFKPGEQLSLSLDVDNKSPKTVPDVEITLKMLIRYSAYRFSVCEKLPILKCKTGLAILRNSRREVSLKVKIPSMLMPTVHTQLIDLSYVLSCGLVIPSAKKIKARFRVFCLNDPTPSQILSWNQQNLAHHYNSPGPSTFPMDLEPPSYFE